MDAATTTSPGPAVLAENLSRTLTDLFVLLRAALKLLPEEDRALTTARQLIGLAIGRLEESGDDDHELIALLHAPSDTTNGVH